MSKHRLGTLLAIVVGLCSVLALPAAASAAEPGFISGQVTNASTGEPLYFIFVCAHDATTGETVACDETEFNGKYEISLAEGEYKVEFQGGSGYFTQWYNGKASFAEGEVVEVESEEVTENIDAALVERYGKISGTVTDASNGSGIGGIRVCAQGRGETYSGDCETTGPDGSYTLNYLGAGEYTVEFYSLYKYNESLEKWELEGPNYVRQYYNGKLHREEADGVSVAEGSTTTGINASMQPGATISGTTTDAVSGGGIQGIYVCAWGATTTHSCSQTDKDGNYSIPALPADSYKVEFQPEYFFLKESEWEKEHWMRSDFPVMDYLRQYWNEKFSFEAAESIAATAGSSTTGINAKMTKEVQPPPPISTAKAAKTAKVKGGKVLLKLSCPGPGDCTGSLKLTARKVIKPKKKGKGHKRNHKRSRTVTIGKNKFSVHAGTTAIVKVKLNGAGKSLFAQSHGKLKATLSGTHITKTTLTLKGKAPKKKHHKKKHRKH